MFLLADTEDEELPTTTTDSYHYYNYGDNGAVESRAVGRQAKKAQGLRYPNQPAKRDDVRAKLMRLLRREMQRRHKK